MVGGAEVVVSVLAGLVAWGLFRFFGGRPSSQVAALYGFLIFFGLLIVLVIT